MSERPITSESRAALPAALEVHLLGLVDFDSAITLQERLVFEISGRDDQQGALLLCEHPPLITLGREASAAHVQANPADLRAVEIDVRWISRGGGAIPHAPGQLAVYPILPLQRIGLGLSEYRARLENALVAVCRDLHIPAKRRPSAPGIWSRAGRVGFTGAAVKSWTSYFGAYLNVDPDPSFLTLASSDPDGVRSTSLQAQRLQRINMSTVRESALRHVAEQFGYARHHVYAGHPLLKRGTQKVCLHA
jgi:lipoyl(octanoyl) transferase